MMRTGANAAEMTQAELETLRRPAFAIAYRMLGSVAEAEAEDVAGEALLRVHTARRRGERIDVPAADGGGRCRRWPDPCTAQTGWHGRWRLGCARARDCLAPRCGRWSSTVSQGALILDATERVIGVLALEIADERIQGIKSIVNSEKLAHSVTRRTWACCCAGAATAREARDALTPASS